MKEYLNHEYKLLFPYMSTLKESNKEWGLAHGEEFRVAIAELTEIRRHLMLAKKSKTGKEIR